MGTSWTARWCRPRSTRARAAKEATTTSGRKSPLAVLLWTYSPYSVASAGTCSNFAFQEALDSFLKRPREYREIRLEEGCLESAGANSAALPGGVWLLGSQSC
ncbi:hypothetical protein V8C44DRAFT_339976 [Trichoderma aethiopicum]